MEPPIACSLSRDEYATRTAQIAVLLRAALRSREAVEGGQRLTFAAGDDTERDLRALIAAEGACCPFLEFELERDGDYWRLDVTGPADAQPIIAALAGSGGTRYVGGRRRP